MSMWLPLGQKRYCPLGNCPAIHCMCLGSMVSYLAPITRVGTVILCRSALRSQNARLPPASNSLEPSIAVYMGWLIWAKARFTGSGHSSAGMRRKCFSSQLGTSSSM